MNRCDSCGRFARWEDLEQIEHFTLYEYLRQEWYLIHRDGTGCARR